MKKVVIEIVIGRHTETDWRTEEILTCIRALALFQLISKRINTLVASAGATKIHRNTFLRPSGLLIDESFSFYLSGSRAVDWA
jgi:hypothetical protein